MTDRSFTSARGRIHYSVEGEGPPLVLLHPIGMDMTWWDDYRARWIARYRVICVDLLGHGKSDPVRDSISLAQHADDVNGILAQEGVGPAALVGVSMGGMVAQHVAVHSAGLVSRLVLCATAGSFPAEVRPAIRARGDVTVRGNMGTVVEATMARWFSADAPEALRNKCRDRLIADDWHSWSANWLAISELDVLDKLASFPGPVLVVAGEADASIPAAVSRQIVDVAPDARFITVPHASHFAAFESPAKFQAIFDSFLAPHN